MTTINKTEVRITVRLVKLQIIAALFTVLGGCNGDPYATEYTTDEPRTRDVVGSYEFQMQTVDEDLNEKFRSGPKPVIIISPNHTFMMHRMPTFKSVTLAGDAEDKHSAENYKSEKQITVSGKWQLQLVGADSDGKDLKKHWGIVFDNVPVTISSAGLLGPKNPRSLIFMFGKASEGKVMILSKK
jgi:hypothetical protein